jgi:hypothetical protein
MPTIKAHFDGSVFVPDGPVQLPAGQPVMVYRASDVEPRPLGHGAPGEPQLRPVLVPLDPEAARRLMCDAQSGLEVL